MMYDTVNFWLHGCYMAEGNPFAILQHLTDTTEIVKDGELLRSNGKIDGYNVNVSQHGVSFKGSLSKFYLPSNVYTLTKRDTQLAIEKMSDLLHIDMNEATVNRLDISTVLPMKYQPKLYYNCLGGKPYFTRIQATADTLYYNTMKKQLIFYDKTKEAKAKHAIIPDNLKNCNLLRYELRYLKGNRLKQQFKTSVTAPLLYNDEFYHKVINNWSEEFERINKINRNIVMSNAKTPKQATDMVFSMLLQEKGQSYIDDTIMSLKAENAFDDPKYYTRFKNTLNKMMRQPTEEKDELLEELERAVKDVAINAV